MLATSSRNFTFLGVTTAIRHVREGRDLIEGMEIVENYFKMYKSDDT
jgi:hypothetical protein